MSNSDFETGIVEWSINLYSPIFADSIVNTNTNRTTFEMVFRRLHDQNFQALETKSSYLKEFAFFDDVVKTTREYLSDHKKYRDDLGIKLKGDQDVNDELRTVAKKTMCVSGNQLNQDYLDFVQNVLALDELLLSLNNDILGGGFINRQEYVKFESLATRSIKSINHLFGLKQV